MTAPAPLVRCITLGAGKNRPRGRRSQAIDTTANILPVLAKLTAREAWWAGSTFESNHREGKRWRSGYVIGIDIDHEHDADDQKVPLPNAVFDTARALLLPACSLLHRTPHGLRVVFVLAAPTEDRERFRAAWRGAGALVAEILRDLPQLKVDPVCIADLARFFYGPNAEVDDVKRHAEILSGARLTWTLAELAQHVVERETPATPPAASPAPRRESGDETRRAESFDDAARSFNLQRTPAGGWGRPGSGTCPVCQHRDCFGSLPDAPMCWCCFSANHGDVGLPTRDGKGRHGDALDIVVHARNLPPGGVSRADVLRDEGYLPEKRRGAAATATNDDGALPDTRDDVRSWPTALGEAAMNGLAGEFVRAVAPYTEADPVAILVHALAAYGVALNKGPHLRVGADRHSGNLNIGLVGSTSTGRKGSSWSVVRELFRQADGPQLSDPSHPERDHGFMARVLNGLTSGEGLIHEVRDAVWKKMPVKEGRKIVGYEDTCVDPGVDDKRLLVVEPELGRTFGVMRREGNTLSAVLRQAWDGDNLRVMAKNAGETATAPHIGVVGHITQHELLSVFDDTAAANGFGNRFAWISCRRSKLLPDAPSVPMEILTEFGDRIRGALQAARKRCEMQLTPAAKSCWRVAYGDLTADRPGLLGSMLARGAPIVLRLALVYACIDGAAGIDRVHLDAALELWRYSADSAAWIFGERLGDPIADRILAALRERPAGLTQTEVRDLFARNVATGRMSLALTELLRLGVERIRRPTGGRTAVVFRLGPTTETTETTEVGRPEHAEGASVVSVVSVVAPDVGQGPLPAEEVAPTGEEVLW